MSNRLKPVSLTPAINVSVCSICGVSGISARVYFQINNSNG